MAYGQPPITVEIPFAFRAGTAMLPAGSYLFYHSPGAVTKMTVENAASHQIVYSVGAYMDSNDTPAEASAVFVCTDGSCWLSAIRTHDGTLNYARHKIARDQSARVSVVSIPQISAKKH
jgi:hypothetical protein